MFTDRVKSLQAEGAYAVLARSGFSPDVCGTVAKRILREADAEAADNDDLDTEPGA